MPESFPFYYQKSRSFSRRHLMYIIGLFTGVSAAMLAYIQSSFLVSLIDEKYIGLVYTASSIITLICISYFVQIINRLGNKTTSIFVILTSILSLLVMADGFSLSATILSFVVYLMSVTLFYINADISLESVSTDEETGRIRGTYYTLVNTGWLLAPLAAGWMLERFGFSFMFTLSAFLFGVPLIIIILGFGRLKEQKYRHPPFLSTLKEVWKRAALRNIFVISFVLQFFYAWMVIYTPIYLNTVINLPWSDIGLILTVMLVPFVLIEYPAGFLADKYWGEKEMLIAGLIVMGTSSVFLFFIKSASVIIWAAALFVTRIGASLVEIMRDTYFFKQISAKDIHLINFFRNAMPLAYIIAPILASGLLIFFGLNFLFLAIGAVTLIGTYSAFALKDTN